MLRSAIVIILVMTGGGSFNLPLYPNQSPAGSRKPQPEKLITQGPEATASLAPGQTRTGTFAASSSQHYKINLPARQYVSLRLDPQGRSADLTVWTSAGHKLLTAPVYSDPGTVSFITQTAGQYEVEIHPTDEHSKVGTYSLKVIEQRPPVAFDQIRLRAESAFAAGERQAAQGIEASRRESLKFYEQARLAWRRSNNLEFEAKANRRLGKGWGILSDFVKALTYQNQALGLAQQAGDKRGEIEALNAIAYLYTFQGKDQAALDLCERAITLSRAINYRAGEAEAHKNLGECYYNLSNTKQSLYHFNQSLELWQTLAQPLEAADVLAHLSYVYLYLSDPAQALSLQQRALQLLPDNNKYPRALVLHGLGLTYRSMSEFQQAFAVINQSVALFHKIGQKNWEGMALNALAQTYSDLGEEKEALIYFSRAFEIFRRTGDQRGLHEALIQIGDRHLKLSDRKAFSYYQPALKLARATGNQHLIAYSFLKLAEGYVFFKEDELALTYFRQALALSQEQGDLRYQAWALTGLGQIYVRQEQPLKAWQAFDQALTLRRQARDYEGELIALYNLAALARADGRLAEAVRQMEKGFRIIESIRTKVESQGLRATYFATVNQYYEFYLDLLMRLHEAHPAAGYAAAALQASEQGRARSLLELLAQGRVELEQEVDPTLLAQARALQRQLDEAVQQQATLTNKAPSAPALGLAEQVRQLALKYDEVKAQLRASHPTYAALADPQPLKLPEIQQLLDEETLLLEYALGDEQSYLWAVTPRTLRAYKLPKRTELEQAAQQVYRHLTARQPRPAESQIHYQRRVTQASEHYRRAATALSEILLGPVAGELGTKRLVIVPSGSLQYLPFSALPKPRPAPPGGDPPQAQSGMSESLSRDRPPLMVEHEIVNLPSASVLAVLRQQVKQRPPAAKEVLVLADPVFDQEDARLMPNRARRASLGSLASQRTRRPPLPAELAKAVRAAQQSGLLRQGTEFPRLLASRQEATAIISVAGAEQSTAWLDFQASRAAVLRSDLAQYRILHFATHGLLNNEQPELSGLVLSLVNEQGKPQAGFLGLNEIYNLNLAAELVVLSACQTALGKPVKGEGLIGLTRGFMYAGAPRVMASLWNVDDAATAELMGRFYRALLVQRLRPVAALRAAQLELWQERRWREPYYWASFILQGDWQ